MYTPFLFWDSILWWRPKTESQEDFDGGSLYNQQWSAAEDDGVSINYEFFKYGVMIFIFF
jgi:hypothetical protein